MKQIGVGQVLQILANVGVVAGIIFLVIELRQNNAALRAEARATRAQIRIDGSEQLVNNPELRAAALKMRRGDSLDEDETFLLETNARANLTRWQYIYGEYRAGLIDAADVPIEDWRRAVGGQPQMVRCGNECHVRAFGRTS